MNILSDVGTENTVSAVHKLLSRHHFLASDCVLFLLSLNCAGPVQPGRDLCSTRSFRVHVIQCLALLHDAFQRGLVLVETCP